MIQRIILLLFCFVAVMISSDSSFIPEDTPEKLAVEGRTQISPSGEYVLKYTRIGTSKDDGAIFVVLSNDGGDEIVYESDHILYPWFTHYVMWDESTDRVWMYDGDTGIYFIECIDGVWERYARWPQEWLKDDIDDISADEQEEYTGEVTIPSLLIKLRPHLAE